MPITPQTSVPLSFTAGDTVSFLVEDTAHPASTWTCAFAMTRDGVSLARVDAEASGSGFVVTFGAGSNIPPGPAWGMLQFTEIATGQRESVPTGTIRVLADPGADVPKTQNMLLLDQCNAAMLKLLTSGNHKVEFQGQMFERHQLKDLQMIRDRLQAAVQNDLRGMGIGQPGGAKILQNRFR